MEEGDHKMVDALPPDGKERLVPGEKTKEEVEGGTMHEEDKEPERMHVCGQ